MKILSIRQPWACLIAHGIKDIENRTWSTNYRGPVLIHASRKVDCDVSDVERRLGIELPRLQTPTGGIVGITNIVDCVQHHDSQWFGGPVGFVLAGSRSLTFLGMKGSLGLRNAPAEVLHHFGLDPPAATSMSAPVTDAALARRKHPARTVII